GLLRYSFLFVLIWLAWSGHTLYSTRFDSDDLAQSFIAAVMAANAEEALDSTEAAGVGAAYAGRVHNCFREFVQLKCRPLIVAMGTAGETACPTSLDQSFGEVGGAGG